MAIRVPYGGQAVIEGVMIRGKNNIAIAVRRPDNEIQLKTDPIQGLFTGTLKKVPFVRGIHHTSGGNGYRDPGSDVLGPRLP